MGREYELPDETTVDATPEQVWQAIATGPGIDSWFMGRNEVDPGEHGAVRTAFGGYTPEHRVTAWEPGQRLAYGSRDPGDGRTIGFEFLLEGRDGGSTVLRMVTSGFLPGDDWADEYEAMTRGNALFFRTLAEYLRHFTGRTATPVTAFGPPVSDWDQVWATLRAELGLGGPAAEGDRVRCAPDGLPPIDGVVYFANPDTVGIRTGDAMYRFIKGFRGPLVAAHNLFTPADAARTEAAWQQWLHRVFA